MARRPTGPSRRLPHLRRAPGRTDQTDVEEEARPSQWSPRERNFAAPLWPGGPSIQSHYLSAASPFPHRGRPEHRLRARYDLNGRGVWRKRGGIGYGTPSWTAGGTRTRAPRPTGSTHRAGPSCSRSPRLGRGGCRGKLARGSAAQGAEPRTQQSAIGSCLALHKRRRWSLSAGRWRRGWRGWPAAELDLDHLRRRW